MYWRPIEGESVHGLYTLPRPLKAENAEGFRPPYSSGVVDVSERIGRAQPSGHIQYRFTGKTGPEHNKVATQVVIPTRSTAADAKLNESAGGIVAARG